MIETFDQAARALERVVIKNPPYPIELELTPRGLTKWAELVVVTSVKDRNTSDPTVVRFTFSFSLPLSDEGFVSFVASRVRAAMVHEFDECFHVDGVRIFEPHPLARGASDRATKLDFRAPIERATHE